MNHHLNLFRFFNESEDKIYIENNLSRAFSICLTHDILFFSEYLKEIISVTDFKYLFSAFDENATYDVNLQIETKSIEKENFKRIYAVAMTTDKGLKMDDFFTYKPYEERRNYTDILITIKDIAIVIEVKRTQENCKLQLYNQVHHLVSDIDKNFLIPICFSWQDTTSKMEMVSNMRIILGQNLPFLHDFITIGKNRYPDWFESKPFYLLPFSADKTQLACKELIKRMEVCLRESSYELLDYRDRIGINPNFAWATEIIPEFIHVDGAEMVAFNIWPANTKQQGYHVYNKSLDWTNSSSLIIDNHQYELDISYEIKFCHFNGFVTNLIFKDTFLKQKIHTRDNFVEYSGKWNRSSWPKFEQFLDEHFLDDFNWRSECKWEDNFINTARNYFTVSFGFEVSVYVPYQKFTVLDDSRGDSKNVGNFIKSIVMSFSNLIQL